MSAQVDWVAFESSPSNTQSGTASLNTWTTGTECKRVDFQQVGALEKCSLK